MKWMDEYGRIVWMDEYDSMDGWYGWMNID
jgi:hypothetical protein